MEKIGKASTHLFDNYLVLALEKDG